MIGPYLSQTSVWKRRTGSDGYGAPTFSQTAIPSRWEQKRTMVRDSKGDEVLSEARVYVTAAVTAGDELVDPDGRGWTVITVWIRRNLSGVEEFREVNV